jgi:acetyl esterase/lipase
MTRRTPAPRPLLLACLLTSLTVLAASDVPAAPPPDGTVIPLWAEGVPGAKDIGPEKLEDARISNVSQPTLTYLAPAVDRPNGTAVIICPGGGYVRLSFDREGLQYGRWLGHLGVTTFVLKYRMQEFGHPAPLQDVLRAIRLVRSRAAEFGIDPDRVGVMGSSAGGHLSAAASTQFDHPAGRTGHPLDAVSARPDFAILMYPVITMADPAAHAGSRRALLGPNPSAESLRQASLEHQVTKDTPPTVLVHTQADQAVPVENSLLYFQALTRAGVPAELYAFEKGAHGMGMRDGLGTSSDWPDRVAEWLRARGLLSPGKK